MSVTAGCRAHLHDDCTRRLLIHAEVGHDPLAISVVVHSWSHPHYAQHRHPVRSRRPHGRPWLHQRPSIGMHNQGTSPFPASCLLTLTPLPLPQSYYKNKIEQAEIAINKRTQNLRRLEAQRNALNSRVRLLREELKLLQEPGSYVGEVVKVMGKKKVLVKVQPEGKYGETSSAPFYTSGLTRPSSLRLFFRHSHLQINTQHPRCPSFRLVPPPLHPSQQD